MGKPDGSDKTGEDLVAGAHNFAEDSTFHLAQQRSEEGGHFGGTAILIVEPAGFIKDKDLFEKVHGKSIDGIMATAHGGGAGIIGLADSALLDDFARAHANGAGVFGKGDAGIVGLGQSEAGVIGRGGATPGPAAGIGKPAPGVVGFAGDVEETEKLKAQIPGSTGVFGAGSPGVTGRGILGVGVQGTGDGEAAGVVGVGGTFEDPVDNKKHHGPGVVGYGAGAVSRFPFGDPTETGVCGLGGDGRGGIFESKSSAQVQLVPAKGRFVLAPGHRVVDTQSFTPERVTNPLPKLPKRANGGDLMTLTDNQQQCTLWLCVQDGGGTDTSKASWAQILLGPQFDGDG